MDLHFIAPQIGNSLSIGNRIINVAGDATSRAEEEQFQVQAQALILGGDEVQLTLHYQDLAALPIDLVEIPVGKAAGIDAHIVEDSANIFQIRDRILSLREGATIAGLDSGSIVLRGNCRICRELIAGNNLRQLRVTW